MTIEEVEAAAEQFIELRRKGVVDLRKAYDKAEKTVKAWFSDHPKADAYKTSSGIIVVKYGSRLQLDTEALVRQLGDQYEKFRRRITTMSLDLEPLPLATADDGPSTLRSSR